MAEMGTENAPECKYNPLFLPTDNGSAVEITTIEITMATEFYLRARP